MVEVVNLFARLSDTLDFIDIFLAFFQETFPLTVLSFWLVWGLVFGSFLTCLIYRLPRGLSIVKPRSHCPNCDTSLGVVDLVPVFSYLFFGAKCRHCNVKIPPKYLYVELTVAFSALVVAFIQPLALSSFGLFFSAFIVLYALFCLAFERFLSKKAMVLFLFVALLSALLKWHTLFFVLK